MGFAPWDAPRARSIIDEQTANARAFLGGDGPDASALLPVLHALQRTFGFVSREAVELIAHRLNLTKAEVKGVVSFYKDFRTAPPARHHLALCRAEACQARGSEALAAHLKAQHGLVPGVENADVSLETTYCLGNCALGPVALVDEERLVGTLDAAAVDSLVRSLKERA
jgi:formate dehydrogenase subunit gamma